jgi:hypothetical protein
MIVLGSKKVSHQINEPIANIFLKNSYLCTYFLNIYGYYQKTLC